MNTYIITGASKGIGLALSKLLLAEGNQLVCVARTINEELLSEAKEKNCPLTFLQADLSNTQDVELLMTKIRKELLEAPTSVALINNAGMIDPIGRVEDNPAELIDKSISVNLIAPMILCSAFIRTFENVTIEKKIINISSGAGRNPTTGWSSYCAGKAGLDHFTRVVAAEQQNIPFGVKAISIAPGIIDTGMQETIRSATKDDFEELDRFIQFKAQGMLSTPEQTAQKLVQLMESPKFSELEPILDIRSL
ncbi:(S)-benzoin forming benzil reductase [Caldibacillus lycopersici]|uniref:(S)-benzoin forming benzil reductase n=1 Tax=Perspicuibacillus lycopersici TaxID=1325689 RepID=A0AAE3IV90_9BACI|nr:(S)-benzoin forming benzil reductase [Perspicuibacillus lycopersici]MCU9613514.1 (S)-benzoin forming benzil reductase [Perspicuibacillus lycopersici]